MASGEQDGSLPFEYRISDCLDDEVLLAISERTLGPSAQEAVNAHVDRCPRCLELLADVMRSAHAPIPALEDRAAGELVPGASVDRYRIIEHVGQGRWARCTPPKTRGSSARSH
jgi:hypothetical protein